MRHSGNYVPAGRKGFNCVAPPAPAPVKKSPAADAAKPKPKPTYRVDILPCRFGPGWVCEVRAVGSAPEASYLFSAWADTEGGAAAEAQAWIDRQEARRG